MWMWSSAVSEIRRLGPKHGPRTRLSSRRAPLVESLAFAVFRRTRRLWLAQIDSSGRRYCLGHGNWLRQQIVAPTYDNAWLLRCVGRESGSANRLQLVIRPHVLFAGAVALFLALVVVSSLVGTPHNARHVETLPSVALGWRLLFHVERASALIGALGLVGLVAWRGAHGDLPTKVGNVEYAPKEAVRVTADALAKQDARLRLVEERLGLADDSSTP